VAKKEKETVVKKVVVKKSSNPYAPMLKLLYRSALAIGFIVVAWMAYEIYDTASTGIKQHNQQQKDYREAMGVKEKAEPEKDEETPEAQENKEGSDDEGSGN